MSSRSKRAGILLYALLAFSLVWPAAGIAVAESSADQNIAGSAAIAADGEQSSSAGPSEESAAGFQPEDAALEATDEAAEPADEAAEPADEAAEPSEGETAGPEGESKTEPLSLAGPLSAPVLLAAPASSTGMKARYTAIYDPDEGFPQDDANSWQIVNGNYVLVKAGGGMYTYSNDKAVRLQKAVVAGGGENEFQVYLNVEPQLSWKEFFESLDNYSTHNNSSTFNPSSGCSRLLSQNEYDALSSTEKKWYASINVHYDMGDGTYYDVVRYGNFYGPDGNAQIQPVPNGSYAWASEKFNTNGLIHNINWKKLVDSAHSGGGLSLVIDASGLRRQYSFATEPVYPQTVTDPMGGNIIYGGKVSFDEGNVMKPDLGSKGETLTWSLPTAGYPEAPYFSIYTEAGTVPGTSTSGLVTVLENVEVVQIDGKWTAYYTGILEGRYRIALDVEDSCAPLDNSPAASIEATNGETVLSYKVGTAPSSALFTVPEVRGLLYDLEIVKVDDATPASPVPGAVFALYGADGEAPLATATSAEDGSLKFHNLHFGTYYLEELYAPEGYRRDDFELHGPYVLSWTTNRTLVQDHGSGHMADWASDSANMTDASMPFEVVNTYVMSLTILKQDGGSREPLQGARFSLRADDGDGAYTDADLVAEVFLDSGLTEQVGEDVATGSDGCVSFYGLVSGTYWIVETWTPAGYELLNAPVKMVITSGHKVLFYEEGTEVLPDGEHNVSITIDNYKIPPLPASGASGAIPPIAFGAIMLALSAALWTVGRRRCGTRSAR